MQGDNAARWMELCAQAAVEQDPKKLLALVQEINRLLEKKQTRLQKNSAAAKPGGAVQNTSNE